MIARRYEVERPLHIWSETKSVGTSLNVKNLGVNDRALLKETRVSIHRMLDNSANIREPDCGAVLRRREPRHRQSSEYRMQRDR